MTRPLLAAVLLTACSPTISTGAVSAPSGEAWTASVPVVTASPTALPRQPVASRASRSRPSVPPTPWPTRASAVLGTLHWDDLAQCESGGDRKAVSASGRYRGAFQFDLTTWANYGPAGDPAAASYGEQLRRARALYVDRGRSPWPYCGRFL